MTMTKICTKCNLSKSIDRFSKRSKSIDGLRHWCKDCACLNSKQQRLLNPEKYKKVDKKTNTKHSKRRQNTDKQWRKDNPDRLKERTLMRLYDLSLKSYKDLLRLQRDCCAICNTHQSELSSPLCVDHCHKTGKIRGLLCRRCNSGIGFLNDSKDLCLIAFKYLNRDEA